LISPPSQITRAFLSVSHGINYLTFFDGTRYLGRLQIERNPETPSWMRVAQIAIAEGEISLDALRQGLPGSGAKVWQQRPFFKHPDRLELRGTAGAWRLVLVSPVPAMDPSAQDEVDAYNYLLLLRDLVGVA
jgi:hypothetical protein